MIRLARTPEAAGRPYAIPHVVGKFEIRWDRQVRAWELATQPAVDADGHGMWEFRIGRVVDGVILITELVENTIPGGDPISLRAAAALGELADHGEDLGEWITVEDTP